MLTLPTVDNSSGQMDRQILPVESDQALNSSHTGLVIIASTDTSSVMITLPRASETQNESIYLILAEDGNKFYIDSLSVDDIDGVDQISTSEKYAMVILQSNGSNWSIFRRSGTWDTAGTTTT